MTDSPGQQDCTRPGTGRGFLRGYPFVLPPFSAHLIFWPLFIAGFVLDIWSKSAVFTWLSKPGESYTVIKGFLTIVTAENAGAAFGIATGQHTLLVGVSIAALLVVLAVFLFSANERRIVHVALGLFAAGVCGNLYDRLFNDGLVRDFIDVVYWPGRHWPAFNVADSLLCIAVALLIVSNIFTRKPSPAHARQQR